MLPQPYDELQREAAAFIPAERLITDALRLLAYGSDASFYRLLPKLVVVVEEESEVTRLLAHCRRLRIPVTFRAAGTSLSGQAVSDSVLILLGDGWHKHEIGPEARTIRLQPGIIGGAANRKLAPFGRKIGPDPASIDAAKIGGIAATNASGMCCGTAQNSYHTLAGMRVVLADGGIVDTNDAASVKQFRDSHTALLGGIAQLASEVKADPTLAGRIRHKFRMKNTTGYGLNALVDFDDPIDILTHLMIGSEGTLGFISEITYHTVAEHANKASALIVFEHMETACKAVTILKSAPVAAVELMDRAALRSVEHKPGMPANIANLGPDGAALLVETRAATAAELQCQIAECGAALAAIPTFSPLAFSTDTLECDRYWAIRKGTFPSVGAMRDIGTTVIIEDVAFPVPRLAQATLDLQGLLREHGYDKAIIFGHALEGNLHFVFTQDFNTPAEVERYGRFMDAVCNMVVKKYDGALKAEHGTGRNMAPFVELEWGSEAYAVMTKIKALFDPDNLFNPGVILNDDPRIHLKNLKPLPAVDSIVDKCIECGFCEVKCPSRALTLTPRQRIVGWREVARLERAGDQAEQVGVLRKLYDYQGIDTCAGCGLCATACPVSIETGKLIKSLRGERAGNLAHSVGDWVADHYGTVSKGMRVGLWGADKLHGVLGTGGMSALTGGVRRLSRGKVPPWTPATPRAVSFKPRAVSPSDQPLTDRVVYFPSCAARLMGSARGDSVNESLPTVTERLLRKAGIEPVYPEGMEDLCCGQPFESKGLMEAADRKSAQLETALVRVSEGGWLDIVFDTSPCAYRMKNHVGARLKIMDINEYLHDVLLPRLSITRRYDSVAVHPVCSVRKMGLQDKLRAVAGACARQVTMPDEVLCCGWAGDKGWMTPELNEHALRGLKGALPAGCLSGYSTSRTCEIGLSEHSGVPYRSIVYLVEACAEALEQPESSAEAAATVDCAIADEPVHSLEPVK